MTYPLPRAMLLARVSYSQYCNSPRWAARMIKRGKSAITNRPTISEFRPDTKCVTLSQPLRRDNRSVGEGDSKDRGPSVKVTAVYASASIGTGAFYAFNNFVLPPILKAFGAPDLLIGLLSSTRSIEGALIQPTIGALSDRVWTPVGRRRPFMLVGIPLSAIFFIVGAFVTSLLPLAVIIFLFSIFFNVAVDPYVALLADIVPLEHRGWLSGLSTGVQLVSSVAFLVVVYVATGDGGGVPLWTYALVSGVLLVSFGITVLGVHEPRSPLTESRRISMREYVEAVT